MPAATHHGGDRLYSFRSVKLTPNNLEKNITESKVAVKYYLCCPISNTK